MWGRMRGRVRRGRIPLRSVDGHFFGGCHAAAQPVWRVCPLSTPTVTAIAAVAAIAPRRGVGVGVACAAGGEVIVRVGIPLARGGRASSPVCGARVGGGRWRYRHWRRRNATDHAAGTGCFGERREGLLRRSTFATRPRPHGLLPHPLHGSSPRPGPSQDGGRQSQLAFRAGRIHGFLEGQHGAHFAYVWRR